LVVFALGVGLAGCVKLPQESSLSFTAGGARGATSPDVTTQVELLGNPYQATYPGGARVYARNIWAMCAFNGEVMLGAGNSSDEGPAQNAGPVPLVAFSPSNGHFRVMFTVDDEQIDVFRLLQGSVYIPGHDPRESWAFGNYYRLDEAGRWRKFRNIPAGVHTYDMTMSGGLLFAGLGTPHGAAVAVSTDVGVSWINTPIANSRVYAFLTVQSNVYAVGVMDSRARPGKTEPAETLVGVHQYSQQLGFYPRNDLGPEQLFPGVTMRAGAKVRIARPVSFKDRAAYLGVYTHNDHQCLPFGVFVAEALSVGSVAIRYVALPKDVRAWDLLLDGGILYVLTDVPDAEGTTVRVLASSDGRVWSERLHFRSRTFARSFALLDRDFYFGLGCEVADPGQWTQQALPPETGNILRVKRAVWDRAVQVEPPA
jgi:hypothetical protein